MSGGTLRVRKAKEADYLFWLRKPKWSPIEAAILLAGYEPEAFSDGDKKYSKLAVKADGIHRLIIESINAKEIAVTISPSEWVSWAIKNKLTLPADLGKLVISSGSARFGADGARNDLPPMPRKSTAQKPATQEEIIDAFPIKGQWGDKLKKAPSGTYKWLAGTWAHVGSKRPGDATTYYPVKVALALAASNPQRMTLAACDLAIKKHFPEWWSEWSAESEILRNN